MLLYIKIIAIFLATGLKDSYYSNLPAPLTPVSGHIATAGTKNSLKDKDGLNGAYTTSQLILPTENALSTRKTGSFYQYLSKKINASFLVKKSSGVLMNAINLPHQSRAVVMMDMDHLLYIHTKAEATQLLLTQAKALQKETEKKLSAVGLSLGITLLGSLLIILILTQRQRAKFLNFKLNLARNIHDETNPALLYAKALARSQNKADSGEKTVLEQHIDHTMSLIRSLAHDLKSDKPHTLSDLVAHTEQLLSKLNTDNTFQSKISKQLRYKQFLSYYQFSQLKAILNECITNTIKHAVFNTIRIDFRQNNNQLTISYRDDGKGWDATIKNNGIGIENMKERADQLNGSLELHNQYPNGYCLYITIPLRPMRS